MQLKRTVAIVEQMHADGVIGRYAIGGTVAASFYLEPMATQDIDVFLVMDTSVVREQYRRIYQYLAARGFPEQDEYIVVGDWPVQFLPAYNALLVEALKHAVVRRVEDLSVRVFSAEHLAAIALQVGRPKDKARLVQFVEAGVLDTGRFLAILERHGLIEKWEGFKRQFLS